jgi:hypothetical protein
MTPLKVIGIAVLTTMVLLPVGYFVLWGLLVVIGNIMDRMFKS